MIPGNVLRLENISQSLCKILYSVEVMDDVMIKLLYIQLFYVFIKIHL